MKEGPARRHEAILTGECRCGATARVRGTDEQPRLSFAHEPDCPAHDDTVTALLRSHEAKR